MELARIRARTPPVRHLPHPLPMDPIGSTSREKEEFMGEKGYYQDSLQGAHQSLSFMGIRPLFVLKDKWETSPPAGENSYHQIIDPRTYVFLKTSANREDIEARPVGLVQWKAPHTGPGLSFVKPGEGEKVPEPDYLTKIALLNADLVGVGEEEGLDVVSSDDEEGIQLGKGKNKEDDGITVYYPLLPMPSHDRGEALREVLKGVIEGSDRAVAKCAQEWLDEMERVDKFPSVHNKK